MIGKVTFQTGNSFEAFPSGKYTLQLVDGEMIKDTYKGVETDKVKFTFVVLNDVKFKGSDGKEQTTRGRKIWHRFSMYLSPKSFLYAFVKTLDPKLVELTEDQRKTYDLDALMGRQIDALISKDASKDGSTYYNNVSNFEKNETPLESYEDVDATPVVKESAPVATEDELKELGL